MQSGEALTASVHGTEFSIDATASSVTYVCTSGEVNITKAGFLLIGTQRETVSLVDVISAARKSQATYRPESTWYLAKFANFTDALRLYQDQLAAAKTSRDSNAMSAALRNIGIVENYQGQFADARRSQQQALAIYRDLGDRDGEARALRNVGVVQADRGLYAQALQSHQQALAILRELGDRQGEAFALNNVAADLWHLGRYTEALQPFRQTLALYQELRLQRDAARVTQNIQTLEPIVNASAGPSPAVQIP